MNVLTIGGATQDIFLQYENAQTIEFEEHSFLILEEGKKIDVQQLYYATGGGATNSAVAFARLGFSVMIMSKIGDNCAGETIIKELEAALVNISSLSIVPDGKTSTSIIVPCPSGDRTVLIYRGVATMLSPDTLDDDTLNDTQLVYFSSLNGPAAAVLPAIAKKAHERNIQVAVNPGSSQLKHHADTVKEALPFIDILIMNSDEAAVCMAALMPNHIHTDSAESKLFEATPRLLNESLSTQKSCFTLSHFFQEIIKYGPKTIVVTDGKHGVYVAHDKRILFHPGLPATVVSTVGAGDAFGSCFVAQILRGKPIEQAIRAGMLNSISVISHLDAKTGLLHESEVDSRLASLDEGLLQTFPL